jgi:hypothetical protein
MGHWGWRPLLLCAFITFWITGCNNTREETATSSPTKLPPITLLIRTPALNITTPPPGLPMITTVLPSPSPGPPLTQTLIPTLSPPPLSVPQPTCHETISGDVICLGRILNAQPNPVEHVALLVKVFGRDGVLLRQQETSVEQQVIPAGGSAPYRVQFKVSAAPPETLSDVFGGAVASLLRAERTGGPDVLRELTVEGESGQMVNDRYRVSTRLRNGGEHTLPPLRVVVALYDEGERVAGYRIVELDAIDPADAATVEVEIIPQEYEGQLRHTLHIEPRLE